MRVENSKKLQNVSAKKTMINHLLYEFMVPPTSRQSQKKHHSVTPFEQYSNIVKSPMHKLPPSSSNFEGFNHVQQVLKATDSKILQQFQETFLYGVSLEIWRKGRIKPVTVFMDSNFPSLLWISSKTKAFLFDLTFTTISRSDYEIETLSGMPHIINIQYFEQTIPFLFGGPQIELANQIYHLLSRYITYNRINHCYPPYFSRIIKLYTVEEAKDSFYKKKKMEDVLRVSESIGMVDHPQNREVLTSIIERKSESNSLIQQVELNDVQISNYFRISHCNQTLKQVFQKYSGETLVNKLDYLQQKLKKNDFLRFLSEVQGESKQFIDELSNQTKDKLSFYDFCAYLQNDRDNYAASVQKFNENLPITDYYCYSSHNTYLTGNQLTSDSKVDRYLEDLQGGLKCVQIDVHNDGERPIVTHAFNDKSFCKPIDFEQTISQIGRFCQNHTQHYPIILSIQNHAKDENRYKMMNILMKHLHERLFYIDKQHGKDDAKICKTLRELKGKIIIKTDARIKDIMDFKKKGHLAQMASIRLPLKRIDIPQFPSSSFTARFSRFEKFIQDIKARRELFEIKTPKNLFLPVAEMTKVTGLFKSATGVENGESVGYECTSLTNEKTQKADQELLLQYTRRSFLRVYPVATEFASSNYNPVPCLKVGAQIIALNTQTKDEHAWLMMSYFTAGRLAVPAKLGYVEKPLHLRSNIPKKNIERTITIEVCSKEKVTIKFFGTDADVKRNRGASSCFVVRDYLQGFLMFNIGQNLKDCIPLRFMRGGYRVLVAKNEMFKDSGIRILILIGMKESEY